MVDGSKPLWVLLCSPLQPLAASCRQLHPRQVFLAHSRQVSNIVLHLCWNVLERERIQINCQVLGDNGLCPADLSDFMCHSRHHGHLEQTSARVKLLSFRSFLGSNMFRQQRKPSCDFWNLWKVANNESKLNPAVSQTGGISIGKLLSTWKGERPWRSMSWNQGDWMGTERKWHEMTSLFMPCRFIQSTFVIQSEPPYPLRFHAMCIAVWMGSMMKHDEAIRFEIHKADRWAFEDIWID